MLDGFLRLRVLTLRTSRLFAAVGFLLFAFLLTTVPSSLRFTDVNLDFESEWVRLVRVLLQSSPRQRRIEAPLVRAVERCLNPIVA